MVEPQDASSFAWDEVRLWGALVISIVSILWSERNRQTTNRATRKLRAETISLDEFRSLVKTPVLEALSGCEEAATKAEAIAHSGQTLEELKKDIEELNRSTILALSNLELRLSDANESAFADGSEWLDDFNDCEDAVLAGFNEASNTVNSDANRRHALLKVKITLGVLRSKTKARIEAHITSITTKN
ncbi:hypothetical protein G6L08_22750 [Agrobacterium rhizogenes]|nr:hypothetical protein [Rhizobium rhizogenes]